jgi:hypothetical protein
VQVQILAALCAIHNFIHEHDTPPDPWLSTTPSRHGSPEYDGDDMMNPQVYAGTEGNNDRWDEIATAMWEDYQARRMEMGLDEEETDDSGDGDDNNNDTM